MESYRIINELNRVAKILADAERTGKLLVHAGAGDQQQTSKPTDPFPVFFTAEQLVEQIHKGSWHCVSWYLVDKEVIKQSILSRINELQQRLIQL